MPLKAKIVIAVFGIPSAIVLAAAAALSVYSRLHPGWNPFL